MNKPIRLGIRENLAQFSLLVLVNALVGAMVGMERSILPAIAEQEFQLAARTAILSFIVVFGVTKAITNYFAGRFADLWGRKLVLVGGNTSAVPVDLGAVVVVDSCRQRAAWREPGLDLVEYGHNEDRPLRAPKSRLGHGPQ